MSLSQLIEDVADRFLIRMEPSDGLPNVLFTCVTQELQFRVICPYDCSCLVNVMEGNVCILREFNECFSTFFEFRFEIPLRYDISRNFGCTYNFPRSVANR